MASDHTVVSVTITCCTSSVKLTVEPWKVSLSDTVEKMVRRMIATNFGYRQHEVKGNGAMWEGYPVKMVTHFIDQAVYGDHCKHSVEVARVTYDHMLDTVEVWYETPLVVIATNEGGYNTTGTCVDCILDWVKVHRPEVK